MESKEQHRAKDGFWCLEMIEVIWTSGGRRELPQILKGYKPEHIWNVDEMGCFWKALPGKGLGQRKVKYKGGKKAKHRVTIAFFVNAAGVSESLLVVICKSQNPRCFKGANKGSLPVRYYTVQSTNVMDDWGHLHDVFGSLNRKLKAKGRSILLFMDNAGCHSSDLPGKHSNIQVLFLPPNTTLSKLLSLNLGII